MPPNLPPAWQISSGISRSVYLLLPPHRLPQLCPSTLARMPTTASEMGVTLNIRVVFCACGRGHCKIHPRVADQFGDITNKLLSDADRTLADLRDDYVRSLPKQLWQQAFGDLTNRQQQAVLGAIVQFASVAVLSFALVSTLYSGCVLLLASLVSQRATSSLPFFSALSALKTVLDPLSLPARAILAVLLTPSYYHVVSCVQKRLPQRQLVLSRLVALALAFCLGNGLAAAAVAAVGLRLGGGL